MTAETTEKPKAAAKAAPTVQRLIIQNDKGGIGKSLVVQALSLELGAACVDHKVVEAESDPRLQRVLGADRVLFHGLTDDSLRAIRRDPDLLAAYWDAVAEDLTTGVRIADLGANASSLFWRWWSTGTGRMYFGDGTGTGILVVTTADAESLRLAANAMAQVADELPGARVFLIANEHVGVIPTAALDNVCKTLGKRAGTVMRISLQRCVAPAWPTMAGMGKSLIDLATLKPQDLQAHGYKLGAAGRSIVDVNDWLDDLRPQLRGILTTAGLIPAED